MEYLCKRCGYKTEYKHCLIRHLKKNIACPATMQDINRETLLSEYDRKLKEITYGCQHCSRSFNSRSNKSRHETSCNKNTIATLQDQIDVLMQRIDDLQKPSITNNTQNNININVNSLRDFGCENMESLPQELIGGLFIDLRFRELIENLHCAPDYPENHNVRIKSTKRAVMEIYRNNKWHVMTFVNGLNELLRQGQRIFKDYYRNNKDKILEEDMDEDDLLLIIDKLDAIENMTDFQVKPIRNDILSMLESYRSQLANVPLPP